MHEAIIKCCGQEVAFPPILITLFYVLLCGFLAFFTLYTAPITEADGSASVQKVRERFIKAQGHWQKKKSRSRRGKMQPIKLRLVPPVCKKLMCRQVQTHAAQPATVYFSQDHCAHLGAIDMTPSPSSPSSAAASGSMELQ